MMIDVHGQPEPDKKYRPRVVVAEDDEDLRHLIAGCLETDGYHVIAVGTGTALVDALRQVFGRGDEPNLVISDDRMPGARGLHVLRQVRGWGWTEPLVLISAFADEELTQEAEEFGVTVMRKPFDLDDMRTLVGYLAPHYRRRSPRNVRCASCGATDDLRWLDDSGEVAFCQSCRSQYVDFDPDDPLVDLGDGD